LDKGIEPFTKPANTRYTEANNVFTNEMNLIWEGSKSSAEHAQVVDDKVNAVLALPRPEPD
jgi:hypothetical protein